MRPYKEIRLIRSNKRERTITIDVMLDGKFNVRYKSYKLDKETFNYYVNHANNQDWLWFLRSEDYYCVKM